MFVHGIPQPIDDPAASLVAIKLQHLDELSVGGRNFERVGVAVPQIVAERVLGPLELIQCDERFDVRRLVERLWPFLGPQAIEPLDDRLRARARVFSVCP
jgi:hypothetical protein